MPSNIILECSERTGQTEADTNAVWTSSFSNPVPLEDGDILQLNQVIINTQNVSSGGIVVGEDSVGIGYTTITIQVT